MTEKRFCVQERCVVDTTDNETFEFSLKVDAEIICEKLNEIADENKQLKSDNKEYIKGLDLAKATSQSWASDVRELREENCRLEKEKEELKDGLQEFREYCNYLKSILEDNEIWYE